MGTINFERFKQQMEQAKAKKVATNTFNWFKPDAGKRHTFRFLPLKHENFELPLAVFHHHTVTFPDGHFESIACPKRAGVGECPFCAEATRMYRQFTKTDNVAYKDAFKALVAKTHYLLVGYEVDQIDPANVTPADFKIVRASSKANMELLENKISKGVDFVDMNEGRNVELLKNKASGANAITTIVWDFNDPSPAFTGKTAKSTWENILSLSPDISSIITPLSENELNKKFTEYSATPVEAEEEGTEAVRQPVNMRKTETVAASAASAPQVGLSDEELEGLRSSLED